MAIHIAKRGELPIFIYGQSYVGALDAYVAASLIFVFGVSDFALRSGLVVLYAAFLGAVYLLSCLLYDRRVGLISVAILTLGTLEMLFRQLSASGGYQEMLLFAATSLLIASWLAVSHSRIRQGEPPRAWTRRLGAYACLGLAWGLGFWSHPIVLPAVLASAVLLLIYCRHELRTRATLLLLAGLFVGLLPVVLHDLTTSPGHSAIATAFNLYAAGGTGATHIQASVGQRLGGALLIGFPIFTAATPVCALTPQEAWPISPHASAHAVLCTAVHGAWSGGFVALWILAFTTALASLWRGRRRARDSTHAVSGAALQGCRLAVLGTAGLITALYALSPAPALDPRPSARHLIELWIAVPCLVAALLSLQGRGRSLVILNLAKAGVIGGLVVIMILGTIETFQQIPYSQRQALEQRALIGNLERIGATRVYTDYWTCYRMAYESRERVICAVLDEHLRPSENRYPAYSDVVGHDAHASYVFPLQTPFAAAIKRKMARTGRRYRRFVFNLYVVYQAA